ncbi:hypothetical protein RQP53_03705 [Paucibacter sp. APW11]|uniref:Uncharacterized protein n=1 Tax=Roseateles aquae TaxID=3077235 RepID=A0ABU3P719_9BURK|nr:hypothetical protein [Paucibacter sp. APW11]MDT8998379.1 hypothetical protein [Paucibacter sp. APW11]
MSYDTLAQALRDIIDPIAHMERNLEEGYSLDGHAALRAINSREFYVNLARQALSTAEAEKPTQAALDVLAERQRQIDAEGWAPERDDAYTDDELAKAAAAYAMCSVTTDRGHLALSLWPWDHEWFKPSGSRRNLIKAGALILAEIERLDRAQLKQAGSAQ